MKYDVFISYSRKDTPVADAICAEFDKSGISYFIDRQGIGGGLEFPQVLAEAILESEIFLYLASENSYQSKFTNSEVTFAFNKKKKEKILPYIIDGSSLPINLEFVFSSINIRNIKDHPVETVLVQDIQKMLQNEGSSSIILPPKNKSRTTAIIVAATLIIGSIIGYFTINGSSDNAGTSLSPTSHTASIAKDSCTLVFESEESVMSFLLSHKMVNEDMDMDFYFADNFTKEYWKQNLCREVSNFQVKDLTKNSAKLVYDLGQQRFADLLIYENGKIVYRINERGLEYQIVPLNDMAEPTFN